MKLENQKMKILIIEAYSAANIGSGALVENSVALLCRNFPDADIEVLAQTPESIHRLTGLPCYHEFISLPLGQFRLTQVLWLLKTGCWMFCHATAVYLKKLGISLPTGLYTYNRRTLNAVNKIKQADLVVSVGAERINDNFYKAILFSLYMLWMVKSYKKYLVLFPQTIGPFHFKLTRYLSRKMLNQCDVVFLRDQKSDVIVKGIGVAESKVVNTCDVAVLQTSVPPEDAWDLLANYGVMKDSKPLVGMSVMQWTYVKAKGKSGYEEYKKAIAMVADEFIEKKEVHILFIATNVLTEGCREDDVAAAEDILALMKHKGEATILNRIYTPSQMKGIMGLLELCLVTRMHACIFSTGIYTPTASINYQFKLKEYMKLIGLENYTVDIDLLTEENLRGLMNQAWKERLETRKVLMQNVPSWCANLEKEMQKFTLHYKNSQLQ